MGKENVILSFFKKHKIDYIYIAIDQLIICPCIECHAEVELCVDTTNWCCLNCRRNGNLLDMIKYFKQGNIMDTKIYNPKKEKKQILEQINIMIKSSPELESKLLNVKSRMSNLLAYYENKTS
jgi:hypothetical protein